MQLSANRLNPRLLRIGYFNAYESGLSKSDTAVRKCYDYELEYYTCSDGGIVVNGEYLPFSAGEINIRKPGQIVCGVYPYSCYTMCFTFSDPDPVRPGYSFGDSSAAQPLYDNPLLTTLPDKITPKNSQFFGTLMSALYKAADYDDDLRHFQINTLLYQLFYELFSQVRERTENKPSYHPEIMRTVQKIKQNFCDPVSIAELIRGSGLSKTYFHKCFKNYTGKTPNDFVTDLRINHACMLLSMTDKAVSDISLACGYEDPVYFSRIFRKCTGRTPSDYRCRQQRCTL